MQRYGIPHFEKKRKGVGEDPKLSLIVDVSKQRGIAGMCAFEGAGIAMLLNHPRGKQDH
jgi:hypothetical protein